MNYSSNPFNVAAMAVSAPLAVNTQSLDEAREFLSRAIAWPQDGQVAYAGLHWTFLKDRKPFWSGRAVQSLDDAISELAHAKKSPNVKDIYVCLATMTTAEDKTDIRGVSYKKPLRRQSNVVALKSLFLDIDAKGSDKNSYGTLAEAAAALAEFLKESGMPRPTMIVKSGGGLHAYWCLSQALHRDEWQPLAFALAEATKKHGLKCDTQVTIDSARILRIPDTENHKDLVPRPVRFVGKRIKTDYDVSDLEKVLKPYMVALPSGAAVVRLIPRTPLTGISDLSAGIERNNKPVHLDDVAKECAFIRDAIATGGAALQNPAWNLTTLIATFTDDARNDAHRMAWGHATYTKQQTDDLFDRKVRDREAKSLGWPSCITISGTGCKDCQACPHFTKGKSPLNFAKLAPVVQMVQPHVPAPGQATATSEQSTPAEGPTFADPYQEFVGPPFPLQVLPPLLADFVNAQHKALGADPSAIGMAALTAVAGAIHAETKIQMGMGWREPPIIFSALVGPPSAMKSPTIAKVTQPLYKTDAFRNRSWEAAHAAWEKAKNAAKNTGAPVGPEPQRPGRLVVDDWTPEKLAELLARDPAGTLLVQDELAGLIAAFERYGSNVARSMLLRAWNGGTYLKDRIGGGSKDKSAELRVDNLALGIIGGIQPDKLNQLGDLTSDGLLQRILPVQMQPPKRGDERHPVSIPEGEYDKLIQSLIPAGPRTHVFAPDAELVRDRVLDRLYELENSGAFSDALVGAIGKMKGYFGRLALVLHISAEHCARVRGVGGFNPNATISRGTAEAAETLIFDFLLQHTLGLYDVILGRGKDRELIQSIADFILHSPKSRLRPSDFTTGVFKLRGQQSQKVEEQIGRFVAMGWLHPENDIGRVKGWIVDPGLRPYFEARQRIVAAGRATAHKLIKEAGAARRR
jgi:hypothetical protein